MSKEQKIKAAAAYSGISQAKLAAQIGMTASNFNQKLKRDTFTDDELKAIAEALGAKFEPCSFIFPDGMKI
jgi:transcriptional regulator with XRE-family HTH domain